MNWVIPSSRRHLGQNIEIENKGINIQEYETCL